MDFSYKRQTVRRLKRFFKFVVFNKNLQMFNQSILTRNLIKVRPVNLSFLNNLLQQVAHFRQPK